VPDAATYAGFLIAVLTMQLIPGPETMLIISRGIGQGLGVALWTVIGTTLIAGANSVTVACVRPGIAPAVVALGVRVDPVARAAYLTWLGARLMLSSLHLGQAVGCFSGVGARSTTRWNDCKSDQPKCAHFHAGLPTAIH
jgi:threonine/homoserine/homoserine lactone efflux protein